MKDRISLRKNPPNVAVPQGMAHLYIDADGRLVKELPGEVRTVVGGDAVTTESVAAVLPAAIAQDPEAVRAAERTGSFIGALGYFPQAQKSDMMVNDADGSMYVYSGEVWIPTVGAAYAQYAAYVSAVEATTSIPSTGWAEFKTRYLAFLHALSNAGILQNLVDGAYYGTDGQLAVGSPLAFSGTAASTNTGSYTRSLHGIVMDQSDAQEIRHTVTGIQTGTWLSDAFYDYESAASASTFELCDAARNNVAWAYCDNGSTLKLAAKNAGIVTISSLTSNGTNRRHSFMRNRDRQTIAVAFGGATASELWIDGMLSTPSTPVTYSASVDLVSARIGPSFKGQFRSWLIFDKRLSNDEAKAATRAVALLDNRAINMLVEGDSTSESLYDVSGRQRAHWPDKILDVPGILDAVRFGVHAATSGHATIAMVSQFANEVQINIIPGKRNLFFVWGGINDMTSRTPATIYGSISSLARTARNLGCEILVATIAVPYPTSYSAEFATLNGLIRAGYTAGDFDILVDVDAAIPNHTGANEALWYDGTHLNGAGNAIVAGLIADAILP